VPKSRRAVSFSPCHPLGRFGRLRAKGRSALGSREILFFPNVSHRKTPPNQFQPHHVKLHSSTTTGNLYSTNQEHDRVRSATLSWDDSRGDSLASLREEQGTSEDMTSRSLFASWKLESSAAPQTFSPVHFLAPFEVETSWSDEHAQFQMGYWSGLKKQTASSALSLSKGCVVALDGRVSSASPAEQVELVRDAYLRRGTSCTAELKGEFALILWDADKRRVLLACDPSGTRTLAYSFDGRAFSVASRLLDILRHSRVDRHWNRSYFAHIISGSWGQTPGSTAFDGISRLIPGTTVVLEDRRLSIADHTDTVPGIPPRSTNEACGEFRELLMDATRSRFDGPSATCLTLSGGLDSTLVAAALARQDLHCDAFSIVSGDHPELDESQLIGAFCRQYPLVRSRTVPWAPKSEATTEDTFLTDDPIVAADPLRNARRQLWRSVRDCGFTSALGGDGGDELFEMSRRIGTLASTGRWLRLLKVIFAQQKRRAIVWRGLLVPRLPEWASSLWAAREQRRLAEAPWLNTTFWAQEEARSAREELRSWAAISSTTKALRRILAHPVNVGSGAAERQFAFSVGLELRAPLLDRTIVDFVLRLPPELLWLSPKSKPFLRAAGSAWLPTSLLAQPKHIALERFARNDALAREEIQGVRQLLERDDWLRTIVDKDAVADRLRRIQGGIALPERETLLLYNLIRTARWMQQITTLERVNRNARRV
jgi:asparagine synthase (glutamine-hydrolysing)